MRHLISAMCGRGMCGCGCHITPDCQNPVVCKVLNCQLASYRCTAGCALIGSCYTISSLSSVSSILAATPATLAPGGAVTPANTSIITGAVAGGVVLVILVCVLIFVGCGVFWYGRRALLKEDEQVDASFVPQSTGTFSYTRTDNDSTMSPPPSLYNTLPPQSSRPIPVAHKDKEREMEKELLSDNIPDGPLPPTFSPPPTYRNLMEAEQLSPSNMKTSEPVHASHFDQYVARRDEKKGLLFEKEFKVRWCVQMSHDSLHGCTCGSHDCCHGMQSCHVTTNIWVQITACITYVT